MSKRIVLSFDGTWNKPADEGLPPEKQVETNVRRFHESLSDADGAGVQQLKWYHIGVGATEWDKVVGGLTGATLEAHIFEGYRFLVQNYEPGDELYIVGFSRGAYTARSLVGMLRNCGLVKRGGMDDWRIGVAYGIYRTRNDGPDSFTAKAFRKTTWPVQVRFLGVWDTVGALGIPLDVAATVNAAFNEFHDAKLSSIVENAYHAVAIDEHRKTFDVTLWDPSARPDQVIEQRWFAGAHSDVGGGYEDCNLSNISLRWMQDNAAALGLALKPVDVNDKNCAGTLSDSYAAFLGGKYQRIYPRFYRKLMTTRFGNETLDPSVGVRRLDQALGYAPTNEGLPQL